MVVNLNGRRSPAAAVCARRERRSSITPLQRLAAEDAALATRTAKRTAKRTGLIAVDETMVFGRVRMHSVQQADGVDGDDDRAQCLAEKGWARRSVVLHALGPSGAGELTAAPGRETFALDADGAREHEEAFIEYADANFDDGGAEVRSLDQRDRKVGLFGDWLEASGHGKYLEWKADEAHGNLWRLQPVQKVRV